MRMLQNIFNTVLNMSITASVAAVLIICFRLILNNKLPKIFNYALWTIVLIRLLIPFSFSSIFSIFNIIPTPEAALSQSPQYHETTNNFSYDTVKKSMTQEKEVKEILNNDISTSYPAAAQEASADPMQVLPFLISWIWLIGSAGLFLFCMFAYFHTSHRLKEAVLYKHDSLISDCCRILKLKRNIKIYTYDKINTPVVCGLINTRIILPLSLSQGCSESELNHIIIHELVHIKRFDYILKPLYVLALCVHWFNPVVWISFILSQKDMEMSCDARVMSVWDNDIRSEYAETLIKLASSQNVLLNGGLLAFGESNIKSRIKGIMRFKKPEFWLGTAALVILIAIGVLLLTNGQSEVVHKKGSNPNEQLEAPPFDKSKVQEYFPETVVINDCLIKDGPGESYKTIGEFKYGDIVFVKGKYNDWVLCSSKDGNQEFYIKSADLIDENHHTDYNLGIITADEVTVGTITLKKGNLVQVLKRDNNKSCVTIRVIDVNGGKTGWINNSDYTMVKPGVFFNQAYLKKGTVIYKEPSLKAQAVDYTTKDTELFVFINKEQDGWMSISSYGPIDGWVQKEDVYIPMALSSREDEKTQINEEKFVEAFNGNLISPYVTKEMKEKLIKNINSMKEMNPGVGTWRIIYCSGERIILYNYGHIVACDISEKNKGIYSIIELKDLKAGNYQGSEIAMIYSSPDAMACIIGTAYWEQDIKTTKSLYICNLYDGSVNEMKKNYNIADSKVTWYRNILSSTLSPWCVSIKGKDEEILWDFRKSKKLGSIPIGAKEEAVEEHFVEEIDFDTGYAYLFWWQKDENTVIGAPYRKDADSFGELHLSDFEIIEVNIKNKAVKRIYMLQGQS